MLPLGASHAVRTTSLDRSSSLVAQRMTRLPAMQETQVQSLGWEDPLEKDMATHSSILAWNISWAEEPGGLQSVRLKRDMTEITWLSGGLVT